MHNCVSDKEGTIIAWHSHNQGAYGEQGIMGADWGWCVCVLIPLKMERRCRGLRSCSGGGGVCQTFHAETLKVFLLYLAVHGVNNERFVTSVLSHVVENTRRRHSGVCTQLIVLYSTLCKPYNHNPLNSLLLCLLSVFC